MDTILLLSNLLIRMNQLSLIIVYQKIMTDHELHSVLFSLINLMFSKSTGQVECPLIWVYLMFADD